MAHYDCKNCGAHLGIDWGFCDSCTPEEYIRLKKEAQHEYRRVYDETMKAHERYARSLASSSTRHLWDRLKAMEEEHRGKVGRAR